MKTIAFLKGDTHKTNLVYHLAHMWADLGTRVLLVDIDPQVNLTSMCLSEEDLEKVWSDGHESTICRAIKNDFSPPDLIELRDGLALIPGDMALPLFEEQLTLSTFRRLVYSAAEQYEAGFVLFDMVPTSELSTELR